MHFLYQSRRNVQFTVPGFSAGVEGEGKGTRRVDEVISVAYEPVCEECAFEGVARRDWSAFCLGVRFMWWRGERGRG